MAKEYIEGEFSVRNRPKLRNVWLWIIIVTCILFIIQLIFGDSFTNMFLLDRTQLSNHPWMLITAIFMHANFWHIFFNMFAILIFGPVLEQRIGSKKFLFLYLVGGIFANIIGLFFYERALGASGAIMALLGTLIFLMPRLKVWIWGIVPLPLWAAGILWFALDLFGTLDPTSGIGNVAHIAGMIFGLLYGYYLKSKYNAFNKRIKGKQHLSSDDVEDMNRNYF